MAPDRDSSGRHVGGGTRVDIVILSALLFACAAVLAGFSWTRPTKTSSMVAYQQTGALSYAAPTAPTSVYGPSGIRTGQPVYVGDAPTLKVTYKYQLFTSATAKVAGTVQLVVKIGDGQGLNRTLPLRPATPFHGSRATATATLSFPQLQAIANSFNRVTGNTAATYTVAIEPAVAVHGSVASEPLKGSFGTPTKFTFNSLVLVPQSRANSNTPVFAKTGTAAVGKPIVSTAEGSVQVPAADTARLFAGFTVMEVRIGSLVLLAIAVLFGGYFGLPLLNEARSGDERLRLSSRVGASLVDVTALPMSPQGVVELASFDGLVQVGKRLECPLLHLPSDGEDVYAVVDNGTVYLYRINPSRLGKVVPAKPDAPRHAVQDRSDNAPRAQTS